MAYNGWKNRSTWNVALWLGNDYGLYQAVCDFGRNHKGRLTGEDAEVFCREIWPAGVTPDNDSLDTVHWPSIAADIRETAE